MPLPNLANQVRSIPINEVLESMGFKGRKEGVSTMFSSDRHAINVTGDRFFDHKFQKGGGGAIDVVMHVKEVNFKEACLWLSDRFLGGRAPSQQPPLPFPVAPRTSTPSEEKRLSFSELQKLYAIRDDSRWPLARDYLTQVRKLDGAAVDKLHSQNLIYATRSKNHPAFTCATFAHPDLQGEIKGLFSRTTIHNSDFRQVLGSKTSAWFRTGDLSTAKEVVITESPIEALSFMTLHPKEGRVAISVEGCAVPQALAEEIVKKGQVPILALNPDVAGIQGSSKAEELFKSLGYDKPIERLASQSEDWNKDLVNQRAIRFIESDQNLKSPKNGHKP
jgi:hypothetical protein